MEPTIGGAIKILERINLQRPRLRFRRAIAHLAELPLAEPFTSEHLAFFQHSELSDLLYEYLVTGSVDCARPWSAVPPPRPTALGPRARHIPTPGDGSCFFHAMLHALSTEYRAASEDIRSVMTQTVREDFANELEHVLPGGDKTLWAMLGGGAFPSFVAAETINLWVPDDPLCYDLESIQARLRDATRHVGDETFLLAATLMHVNLVIVGENDAFLLRVDNPEGERETVVLACVGNHFELLVDVCSANETWTYDCDSAFVRGFSKA